MSKAFTKDEGDGAAEAVVVPPRASLPEGAINYVTPRGLEALRAELAELEGQRRVEDPAADEGDRRRAAAILDARTAQLAARIAGAVVVDPATQPTDEVRFGATVVVRGDDDRQRTLQIVGVDEADVRAGKIAFIAPIARALLGRSIGEAATVRTPRGDEELVVIAISYR